jgi:hypothetical protein
VTNLVTGKTLASCCHPLICLHLNPSEVPSGRWVPQTCWVLTLAQQVRAVWGRTAQQVELAVTPGCLLAMRAWVHLTPCGPGFSLRHGVSAAADPQDSEQLPGHSNNNQLDATIRPSSLVLQSDLTIFSHLALLCNAGHEKPQSVGMGDRHAGPP